MSKFILHILPVGIVSMLLLIQYVPMHGIAGADSGHYCVECTQNHGTRSRCICGHDHDHSGVLTPGRDHATSHAAAGTHAHHNAPSPDERNHSAPAPEETNHSAPGPEETDHDDPAPGETEQHVPASDETKQLAQGLNEPDDVTLRPCGTSGSQAVTTLVVDFFYPTVQLTRHSFGDSIRRTSTHTTKPSRTDGDDVFHPPTRHI